MQYQTRGGIDIGATTTDLHEDLEANGDSNDELEGIKGDKEVYFEIQNIWISK